MEGYTVKKYFDYKDENEDEEDEGGDWKEKVRYTKLQEEEFDQE